MNTVASPGHGVHRRQRAASTGRWRRVRACTSGPRPWTTAPPRPDATSPDDATLAEARALGPDTYPTRAFYGQLPDLGASGRVVRERARARDGPGAPGARGRPWTTRRRTGRRGAADRAPGRRHPADRPGRGGARPGPRAGPARPARGASSPRRRPARPDLHRRRPTRRTSTCRAVAPGETVLLRGLGPELLRLHGAVHRTAAAAPSNASTGRLVYRPSGREPRLYAGSRRGVPYHARGENEKGAHGRYAPRLLTAEYVAALRAPRDRAASRSASAPTCGR